MCLWEAKRDWQSDDVLVGGVVGGHLPFLGSYSVTHVTGMLMAPLEIPSDSEELGGDFFLAGVSQGLISSIGYNLRKPKF